MHNFLVSNFLIKTKISLYPNHFGITRERNVLELYGYFNIFTEPFFAHFLGSIPHL